MDSSTLLTVVGGVLVLSVIVLTSLCVYCKGSSQHKSIPQRYDPNNGQMNSGTQGPFMVVRPYADPSTTLPTQIYQPQIPSPSNPRNQVRGVSPCPSINSESQSDYVNEALDHKTNGYEEPPKESPDYIDVLPDQQSHQSQQSLVSSSSVQNYENISNPKTQCEHNSDDDDDDDDDNDSGSQNYINVIDEMDKWNIPRNIPKYPEVGSLGSCNSDDPDSSDYVNAPNQVNIPMC